MGCAYGVPTSPRPRGVDFGGRQRMKPWEQPTPPGRRTGPEPLATDRPPSARQPGETLAAYRAFLASLEHGSIRKAATERSTNRSVLERWSRRWRWPERKAAVLASSARQWQTVTDYEERRNLSAAADSDEMMERQMASFDEVARSDYDLELRLLLEKLDPGP